jgi:hypothetical protein
MLTIIFWILFALCLIGAVVPPSPDRGWVPRLSVIINLVLLGILGYKCLPHVPL